MLKVSDIVPDVKQDHFYLNFQEDVRNGNRTELQPNDMMRGLSPSEYVLHALSTVQTNDLEQTLLVCCLDMYNDVMAVLYLEFIK